MNKRFILYLKWAVWVGVAFFSIYPLTNWLTSLRETPLHLYFQQELNIPFLPQFIWFYLSMYVLFLLPLLFLLAEDMPRLGKSLIVGTLISGCLFLLFPAVLGFQRVVPASSPYQGLFVAIFSIDHPHNLVPSLHIVFSTSIILALVSRVAWSLRILFISWLIVIMASTMFVHQHHVLDVLVGFVLAIYIHKYFWR